MKRMAVLLPLLLLLTIGACSRPSRETAGDYAIYILANQSEAAGGDAIQQIHTNLDVAETASLEERAAAVVERILADGGLWEGIQLRSVVIDGRRAIVDLSGQYARFTGIQLSLADYCIALSLTQLDGISTVTITAEGRELPFRESQILAEPDVMLSTRDDVIETLDVELYFADWDGKLSAERRTLEVYEGQTLSESAVEALLEGPVSQDLQPLIPDGFAINSARVEDRVCALSIPSASLELLPVSEKRQRLILQSVAMTIYSLGKADELQILVDGEPCTNFGRIPVTEVQFRPTELE